MNTVRNISPCPSIKLARLLQSVKQFSGSGRSRCLRVRSFSCSLAQGPSCSTVLVSFKYCRASRVKPRLRSTEAGLGAPTPTPHPVHCGAPGETPFQQKRAHGTPRPAASSIRHNHPLGAPQGRRGCSRGGGTRHTPPAARPPADRHGRCGAPERRGSSRGNREAHKAHRARRPPPPDGAAARESRKSRQPSRLS